ncbi:hypothetical protein [Microbacterium sp. 1.5R]|uniref:hypothetical protein n=1 Tax=Microbacterium sp. 1.5R TaxID=1916917 RepID=UPI0011AAFA20|nr:hypothetical protein [Microbacterium sp. 1.5R]
MSTSDQPAQGPLTRKQLRELRLTGSTPVITPEEIEAAAAAAPPAPPAPSRTEPTSAPQDSAEGEDTGETRLTRRQVRERVRTASVPVIGEQPASTDETADEDAAGSPEPAADDAPTADDTTAADKPAAGTPEPVVTAVPVFAPSAPSEAQQDQDDEVDEELTVLPVAAADSVGVVPLVPATVEPEESTTDEVGSGSSADDDSESSVSDLGIEPASETDEDAVAVDDVLADVDATDDASVADDERPTVNSAFGSGVRGGEPEQQKPFAPSFDELLTVGDSTGSHRAPNTLIFTPGPGEGSLSGPVASTGEILITGSYELPKGLGSQGHAHGTTDGKDIDAVLIDGELPPASSPTPIAASSAISTIKPAGEVIRPPAPEKGNRLTIILAIVTGGLALAVGVAVVIAITTNVF